MNTLNVSNFIGKIRKIKVLLEIVTRKYYLTIDIRHTILVKFQPLVKETELSRIYSFKVPM